MKSYSTLIFAVLLCFVAVLLGPISVTDGGPNPNCCLNTGVSIECRYLCGIGEKPALFSVLRIKCAGAYLATVKTCEVKDLFDYVKTFGHRMTMAVAKGFDQLEKTIKEKLATAGRFVELTIDELGQIPQDVLGALGNGLQDMTSGQFTGLIDRLKYFTKHNLHALMSHISTKTYKDVLGKLNQNLKSFPDEFDAEQLRELTLTALRAFGKDVGNWTANALLDMNHLLIGLESSELVQIAGDALGVGHKILCDVNFKNDQKKALLVPVEKAFGDVSDWVVEDVKKICDVLDVLPPTELLRLSTHVVSGTAKFLKDKKFFIPQTRAIIAKVKEAWGEVDSWDDIKIKDLGKLLKGLDNKDIGRLLEDTVKKALAEIGKLEWNEGQARELIRKLKETLGEPEQWTADNVKDLGTIAVAILPKDLQKIGNATLYNALTYLKAVEVHLDQAQVIIQKIKAVKKLEDITKEDLLAMQKVLDGFLSSEIGKMSQLAVTAAFPEIIVAKKVGMPILRALIEQYKKNSGGKIDLFKGFAKALARVELNDTDIKKITVQLQAVGLIEWDITQALELMQRIKREWGDFNGTDDDFHDQPTWGFKGFKKLGRIVLGLSKEDLRILPIRGLADIVEVLGKNTEWTRGQVIDTMKRVREYWEVEGLDLGNLTETDINSLGQFITGLALKELQQLPEHVLNIAVKRLGEALDVPEDKLRSRAHLAIELFKNITGVDVLDGSQVADLGNLLAGVNRAVLKKITKEGFLDNLYQMTRIKGMSDGRLWEIVQLAKKHFKTSDVGEWLGEQWRELGPAIKTMDISELRRISKEAFDELIDELGELDVLSEEQALVFIGKAKEYWKQSDVSKWTAEQLRRLGSLVKGLKASEILDISDEFFKEAVGLWGEREDLDEKTLLALAKKAKKIFVESDASKIAAEHLKLWGRVVLGLTAEDLEKLNIDSIDVIGALGKWKGWTKEQLAKLAPKIKTFLNNANNPDYYMSLGNLATVLSPDDIKRLRKLSFEFSVKFFGQTAGWTQEQLRALADKAKVDWGSSQLWESAQVSELGDILEGLKPSDLTKLRTNAVSMIKPEVIEKLDNDQIRAFTSDQLRSMDSSQVNMISDATILLMSAEQRNAVQSVRDDDPNEPNPWPQESCAGPECPDSMSVQCISNSVFLMAAMLFSLWHIY